MAPPTAPATPAGVSPSARAALAAAFAELPRYREMTLVVDREALAARAAAHATRADGDAPADERIPIALSSETPVLRYDWWEDERYYEVLEHAAESVDLSYARDGLPFLLEHQRAEQHGLIEDVTLGADRTLRGMLRMSKAARSQEIRQDILDGIRKKVSVGYQLLDDYQQVAGENGAPPTRRYRWKPMECSAVSIPADYQVGYGRAAADPAALRDLLKAHREHLTQHLGQLLADAGTSPARSGQEPTMKEKEQGAGGSGGAGTLTPEPREQRGADDGGEKSPARIRLEATESERKRATDITALCEEHAIPEKQRREFLESGAGLDQVRSEVLKVLRERMKSPTASGGGGLDLSDKEAKRYSYARALLSDCAADLGLKVDAGFEREISRELEKMLPEKYQYRGGVLLPSSLHRRTIDEALIAMERAALMQQTRALTSNTPTKGQETVFTQPGEFIALLRARMQVRALGARVLSGLTGPITFPKQTATAVGQWMAENPGADVTDSDLLLGTVTISPKTYMSSTAVSRQLLVSALSGSIDAEMMAREDLATSDALALDRAALVGTGAANQPRGLYNMVGISVEAIGANGGAPTWDNIVNQETQVASANADANTMGYLTHPVMRGRLKRQQKFAGTNGDPVWERDQTMNGYAAAISTQSPSLLTKGTSTDCFGIAFGDWSQIIIGEWGVREVITDPFRLKKQGLIEMTSFQMTDVGNRYVEAFSIIRDARNV